MIDHDLVLKLMLVINPKVVAKLYFLLKMIILCIFCDLILDFLGFGSREEVVLSIDGVVELDFESHIGICVFLDYFKSHVFVNLVVKFLI